MIDLNAVHIFTQVVESGSLSAAGRDLGLPKSTVSRKMKALEEQLGVRLIQRSTRAITLTEAGNRFYQRCQRIVAEAQDAEDEILSTQSAPKGTLRISSSIEEGNALLAPIITNYLHRYPEVDIQMELNNELVDLIEGRFDLVIRAGTLPDSSLIAVKLSDDKINAYASPDYLSKHGTPENLADLQQHTVMVYGDRTHKVSHTLVCGDQQETLRLNGRVAVNSFELLKNLALEGLGIGFVPLHCCDQDVQSGRLIPVLPEWGFPEGGIYVVYPHRKLLSPAVRTFIDHLRTHFAQNQ